jgi:hypothetical protein
MTSPSRSGLAWCSALSTGMVLLLVAAMPAVAADPEETLGTHLSQGAKALTTEQVKRLYTGRRQVGETKDIKYDLTYEADGVLQGNASTLAPPYSTSRSRGTWSVDSDGRMCIKEQLVDWGKSHDRCQYFFHLSGSIIISESSSDPASKVRVHKMPPR